jgi:hypothetical protein
MKFLVIILVGLAFGLSAAAYDLLTGAGFVAALVSYVIVGMTVTMTGAVLLILREVVAVRALPILRTLVPA